MCLVARAETMGIMAWKRNKDDSNEAGTSEVFDAASAASELEQALGLDTDDATDAEFILNLEAEIHGLKSLVAQKDVLLSKMKAEQQEEIERIKRRLKTESDQQIEKRVDRVLNEILDVGDDLGRAIRAAHEMDHNPAVVQGIELVRQSFGKRLQKLGVSRMDVLGTAFDPALHDAVSLQPVSNPNQDGKVLAVASEGFIKDGKVLREAKVVVGKLVS